MHYYHQVFKYNQIIPADFYVHKVSADKLKFSKNLEWNIPILNNQNLGSLITYYIV